MQDDDRIVVKKEFVIWKKTCFQSFNRYILYINEGDQNESLHQPNKQKTHFTHYPKERERWRRQEHM